MIEENTDASFSYVHEAAHYSALKCSEVPARGRSGEKQLD